ncbi:MAG TPA: helix-turn-helix transcriptional regulator [Armatimonadota bacterium]|nr:helix-turn-helix transcriptional regulator [Armatimonadota bacterium]
MMKEQKPFRTTDAVAEVMQRGPESRKRHSRRSFLLSVRFSLFKLRHEAGKSQAEIAEALGTTQSAIARLKKIDPANITLGRLVDYALAWDAAPLDIGFVSVQQLTGFTIAHPELPRTEHNFMIAFARPESEPGAENLAEPTEQSPSG